MSWVPWDPIPMQPSNMQHFRLYSVAGYTVQMWVYHILTEYRHIVLRKLGIEAPMF